MKDEPAVESFWKSVFMESIGIPIIPTCAFQLMSTSSHEFDFLECLIKANSSLGLF